MGSGGFGPGTPSATGVAPSPATKSWLSARARPKTVAPRAIASCTATLPTPPAAPSASKVIPSVTASASNALVAELVDRARRVHPGNVRQGEVLRGGSGAGPQPGVHRRHRWPTPTRAGRCAA
ncbi:hypothetical protein FHX82_004931 [Amycolatopsis bartoniae]|uniref:hypothetical protein n=1 Tax=Amycolatopsis bartoniae TaxID=941986 RepID=UPI0016063275|nr:hypothetical protein [Amycolatopsis bartoniae]MBB2937855.1 hypothetical protein [Amycolatopsis bartoniae]